MEKLTGIIKLGVYKDMIPNNKLYKLILEKLEDIQVTGYHDSMYYMKRIAEHYGASYSTCVCSNKYLKDFAEAITEDTYSENLPNKIYLHDIAEELGSLLEEDTENYYLMEIYELIDATQKTLTTLTINVPLNIVYSDEFNITGTLIDEDNNPVTSASVNLLVGNTIVETNTTNNQGEVSFTRTPVHTGNHSFQLTYNGDITYKTSRSSIVERVIGKETSVLTLINPIDQSNHIVNTSVTISGTLLDDDGDPIPNASISLSTGETVTTGSNGSFITSHTFTSIMDDLSVIASYNGDDNYTSSTATRVINIIEEPPAYDGITLTGTQSILSYYDSDTCTLTAQVTNNGEAVAVPDIIVTFYDNDDTILDTALTDGTGKARYVYQSQGIGDIGIIASVGSIFSEIYISDIYWYSSDGTKLTGTYSTGSDSNYSYITNLGTDLLFPAVPDNDFELSMKAFRPTTTSGRALLLEVGASKSDTLLCGWDSGASSSTKNVRIYRRSGSSNTSVQNNTNPDYNNGEWVDFKLRFENGSVTLTVGGTSVSTSRSSVSRIGNYDSSTSRLSEMQIRTL